MLLGRKFNPQLLERMLEDEVAPINETAVTFVKHLGWKAPMSDPPQAIAAYVGFTRKLGVPVSAKLLDVLITAASNGHVTDDEGE